MKVNKNKYERQDVLLFGKYKGKTIAEVLKIDSSYLNWCLTNVGSFKVSDELAKEIKEIYQRRVDENYYYYFWFDPWNS